MTRRQLRLGLYAAALVAVLLVLATTAVQTPTGDVLRPSETTPTRQEPAPGNLDGPQEQSEDGSGLITSLDRPDTSQITALDVLLVLGLALLAIIFASLFVGARNGISMRERFRGREPHTTSRGTIQAVTATATDEALELLNAGHSAEHVVIEFWKILNSTVKTQGVSTTPSHTSSELVAAIIEETPVTPSDVTELAGLYQSARYSGQLPTDFDVNRARTCLTSIQKAVQ